MLIALLFLAAALFVFFDLVQPTYGVLQEKKGTEASTQILLANEQKMIGQAKNLISEYQNASQAQSDLALAMPSGPSVANALAQVYGIAAANNVSVQSIAVAPPAVQLPAAAAGGTTASSSRVTKPMGSLSIQFAAVGSYESLKSFLAALETNLRIFDVAAFSLQPSAPAAPTAKGAGNTQDLFTYNITVVTYYQIP